MVMRKKQIVHQRIAIRYVPDHGVYHPRKPEKNRVVFYCSARFEGTSLNDHLLTGPDLINALAEIFCRSCKHPIAIMYNMFNCFHVSQEYCDFLRFLWWKNGNTDTEPINIVCECITLEWHHLRHVLTMA